MPERGLYAGCMRGRAGAAEAVMATWKSGSLEGHGSALGGFITSRRQRAGVPMRLTSTGPRWDLEGRPGRELCLPLASRGPGSHCEAQLGGDDTGLSLPMQGGRRDPLEGLLLSPHYVLSVPKVARVPHRERSSLCATLLRATGAIRRCGLLLLSSPPRPGPFNIRIR